MSLPRYSETEIMNFISDKRGIDMIRKATAADIDAVAEIYLNIHEQERLGRIHTGWLPDIYPLNSTAETALNRDDLFVYENGGKILATAIINQTQVDVYADCNWNYPAADSEVMVLHTLAVDPSAIKNGIGREFVGYYENYARKAGCTVLRMDTNAKNTVARSFYKKLGYIETAIVPCVFNGIPDVQLVLLEKKL